MGGGWEDYVGSYDTKEEAARDFEQDYNNKDGNECYNIVDTTTMKLIQAGTYGQAARKPRQFANTNTSNDVTFPSKPE
jgi:hypothetical protein